MKKIIKNRLYDTDKAKLIGEYAFSNRTDFNFFEESLYCKKTGEYFLYCVGGPLSKYATETGANEVSGSEKIIPLEEEDAKMWAEKHLDTDTYIKEFGDVAEQKSVDAKIKKIRQISGLTQEEFSKKYNIPTRTIENWESGDRVPPEYVVMLLEFKVQHDLKN